MLTKAETETLNCHKNAIMASILAKSHIVLSTVTSINPRFARAVEVFSRMDKPISALVCDEASLLTVPSALSALTLGAKRTWLLGDDCQLRPVVADECARHAALDVSLLEFSRAM